MKVKEPLAPERKRLRAGQVLFTYLHLAPDPEQTQDLLKSGVTAIAYETVTSPFGTLPLLTPMSEIAGRLAPQVGARYLERTSGGRGVLLGGVPGVPPAEVVVLGGGVSGTHAATIALGMGATVTIVDRSAEVLRRIAVQLPGARTIFSTHDALVQVVRRADLLIGAVLVPGAAAPKLVTRDMVKTMKTASVLVDIAIDQGGCSETSRPTSHSHPVYVEEGVTHFCVTNMPGAVVAHLDLRAEQRDAAVRAGARRQGLAPRDRRGSASAQRAQRPCRHARPAGRSPRRRGCLYAARAAAA